MSTASSYKDGGKAMQAKELEFWIASERNGEYPFTREDSFERKLRRHRKLHAQLGELLDTQQRAIAYLERVEMEYLLQWAALTPRQRYVCEQYLNGLTLREIGRRMGISKQAAAKTLKFALLKLKRAWRSNPFHGLAEVYRLETTRYSGRR
ncbi:MAG: sigma factor-like helix-turn-helix DNA-binding protein [Armatimonadota bacterium]|nr:sigma factor-like helix-turn-helix DNA-binding protein [Armatimonadota bacterium]